MFPPTITINVATGQDRVLNRLNQDAFGSEYGYSDANEGISMKIRHSTDSVDKDGIAMKRHNVLIERVVYPTPIKRMEKYTATTTMRAGSQNDPALCASLMKGLLTWENTGTNLADLSVGVN